MASNITGNVWMEGESLRRAVAADPNLLTQLQNLIASFTSGGGDPHKLLRLLGTLVLSQQFQVVFALLAVLVARSNNVWRWWWWRY
jgi:hypothetical protein